MDTGIYKIECQTTDKFYIGSSISIRRRIWEHKSLLRRGLHTNQRLQNAWNKYGEDSFMFSIVELTTEEDLYSKEQYYLDKFNSYDRNVGYNISSRAERGEIGSEFLSKTYIIIHPNGKEELIKSLNRFCKLNNLSQARMWLVAEGKANQHKGFHCRKEGQSMEDWNNAKTCNDKSGWKMSDEQKKLLSNKRKGIKWTEERRSELVNSGKRKGKNNSRYGKGTTYIAKDENDNIIYEFTMLKIATEYGFYYNGIKRAILNNCKYKDFYWEKVTKVNQ